MPKSKVTRLQVWANGKPDTYGNMNHDIDFEDGTTGVYSGNPNKGLKFKVGETYEYEVEEKVWSKSGKPYKKIKPYSSDYNANVHGTKGQFKPKTLEEKKKDSALLCDWCSVQFLIKTSISSTVPVTKDVVVKISKKFLNWIFKDGDIPSQDLKVREKMITAAIHAMDIHFANTEFSNGKIDSTDKVLQFADFLVSNYNSSAAPVPQTPAPEPEPVKPDPLVENSDDEGEIPF